MKFDLPATHHLQLCECGGVIAWFADLPAVQGGDLIRADNQCLGFAARDFACFGFCQPQCGLRRGFAGVSPVNGVSSIPGIMTVKGICRRSSKARR